MRLPRRQLLGSFVLSAAPGLAYGKAPDTSGPGERAPTTPTRLETRFKSRTDDWDSMLKRRFVRLIVPYSRTLFFRDKAVIYGTAANGAELLEKWINTTYKTGARPVTLELSPVTRDRLIPALLAGEGDVALGDITVTPERAKLVAFTTPVLRNVREVIVTSDDVPDIPSPEALSGMTVMAREGSSFQESLVADGKAPVKIVGVPPALETEDLMEMAAAGLVPAMVADDWIANLWAGLDTLMLMAQGYQESRLDQNAKSAVGAVGIMQLMPATGQSLGVGNIRTPEPNVHAGAKYMRRLLDTYFKDSHFDEQNRNLFAFAAYNAGPGRVHSLQVEATEEGLNPNVWFDNVERVCAARAGQETVRYVRNIYKYYIAYKLIEEADAAKKAAIQTVPRSD
jgi:membrane-bound lytic murein transglycosylase MltF